MLSSGHRSLLGEAASWMFFAAVTVAAITHFEELTAIAHQIAGTRPALLSISKPDRSEASNAAAGEEAAGGDYVVELPIGGDGHYHAEAEINGRAVQVLVDTGASVVALTAEDADTAGIYVGDKDFTQRIQTANGTARVAPVLLDEVSIGGIRVRDVRGVVSEPGALHVSLLGMTFLNQLERVDMRSGKLILEE